MSKQVVAKLVADAVGAAACDLHRATMAFSKCDMSAEHGESGHTRQEILDGYKSRYAELLEAKAWVDKAE